MGITLIAAGLLESGICSLPLRKMRIFKMSQKRQVYREDETAFPPSPEEPGVNGNLLLPELTVGKFFVGIKKLGEKKKEELSPSNNFIFCFNNKYT